MRYVHVSHQLAEVLVCIADQDETTRRHCLRAQFREQLAKTALVIRDRLRGTPTTCSFLDDPGLRRGFFKGLPISRRRCAPISPRIL